MSIFILDQFMKHSPRCVVKISRKLILDELLLYVKMWLVMCLSEWCCMSSWLVLHVSIPLTIQYLQLITSTRLQITACTALLSWYSYSSTKYIMTVNIFNIIIYQLDIICIILMYHNVSVYTALLSWHSHSSV